MAPRKKKAKAPVLIDGAKRVPTVKDEASALGLSDEAIEREIGGESPEPEPKPEPKPEPVAEKPARFLVVKGKSISCRDGIKAGEIKASDVIGGEATLLDLESRGLVVRE